MSISTFNGLLLLMLIGLKLAGFITWSWWWVFAPAWVPAIIAAVFLVFAFAAYVLKRARQDSLR